MSDLRDRYRVWQFVWVGNKRLNGLNMGYVCCVCVYYM